MKRVVLQLGPHSVQIYLADAVERVCRRRMAHDDRRHDMLGTRAVAVTGGCSCPTKRRMMCSPASTSSFASLGTSIRLSRPLNACPAVMATVIRHPGGVG